MGPDDARTADRSLGKLPPRRLWPDLVFALPDLHYPDTLNVAEQLLESAALTGRGPDPAIMFGLHRISYFALRDSVTSLAASLSRRGVCPGDRVALRLPNTPDFIITWLAVQWIGAVAVPIPPPYRRREIAFVINDSSATMIVAAPELVDDVVAAENRFERSVPVLCGSAAELGEPNARRPEPYPTARYDPAAITYIAAADGTLKGVVHSPSELLATADTYAREVLKLTPDDVCIGQPTLSWAFGLGASLVFPLRFGAATALVSPTSLSLVADIQTCRATVLFAVPTMYRLLLAQPNLEPHQFASVRVCVSAAEPLPAVITEMWRARTGLDLLDGLGSTEMAHIFISARSGCVRPGWLGTPVRGYEAKIVDEDFTEQPPGGAGLLAVRGPTGCRYWGNLEAQRRTVRFGWTLTGDVCVKDSDGSFRHLRRSDNLIVSGGYKISIKEVEQVLCDHPEVASARVFAEPDEIRGTIANATVACKSGGKPARLPERLHEFLTREIAPYKCPRSIRVVETL